MPDSARQEGSATTYGLINRRAFPKFESCQTALSSLWGPGMDDGLLIEEVHWGHDAVLRT